jgi:hypothetical protein
LMPARLAASAFSGGTFAGRSTTGRAELSPRGLEPVRRKH